MDSTWKIVLLLAVALPAGLPAQTSTELSERQLKKILSVQTLHIDDLSGPEGAQAIRDMLIGSLQRTGLFVLTEDDQQADAFLRGSAEDLVFSEYFRSREGINVRGAVSNSRRESGESNFGSASFGVGDNNDVDRRERKHEAMAAVRLVLRNGEVVWSTTQESNGAKFRGPAADVADKVAKELVTAVEKARRLERGKSMAPVSDPSTQP